MNAFRRRDLRTLSDLVFKLSDNVVPTLMESPALACVLQRWQACLPLVRELFASLVSEEVDVVGKDGERYAAPCSTGEFGIDSCDLD